MSLGFTKVGKETAEVINNVIKKHMTELAHTVVVSKNKVVKENYINHFIEESLLKLSFTMSDRANNEKLADKLLSEWRDGVLKHCNNENEKQAIVHFHCMAHVLLGFHRYVTEDRNPFPNKPWFLRVCNTSLLKTLWEKEKLLVMSNFSFSHSVFYLFG